MSVGAVGYTPGSLYKRHGIRSMQNQGNMQRMNRESVASYNSSFVGGSVQTFDANFAASQGKSELVAQSLLQKVKAAAQAIGQNRASIDLGSLLDTSA